MIMKLVKHTHNASCRTEDWGQFGHRVVTCAQEYDTPKASR